MSTPDDMTDAEALAFLDGELPGWRELPWEDVKQKLAVKVDEMLDLMNDLRRDKP